MVLDISSKNYSGQRKKHHRQRRDSILRCFLRPENVQFSPHIGAIPLLNCTENLERKSNNPLEKILSDSTPVLLLSCMVDRPLRNDVLTSVACKPCLT